MKFTKETASFLLSALLLSSCGAAAGETPAVTDAETVPVTEAVTEDAWDLPVEDFQDYSFRILTYNNMYEEHRADSEIGEAVNDAVYRRNRFVEEKYHVKIVVEDMDDSTYQSTLRKNVSGGDDAYDLYQIFLSPAASVYAPAGYFVDWNEIPYVRDALNDPQWNLQGQSKLTIKGKNYLLTGDLGHLYIGNSTALFFNKTLFRSEEMEFPYQSVLDGTWTLDKLIGLCTDYNSDLNGDGKITEEDDRFAITSTKWVAPVSLFVGCDLNTLTYDDTGYPSMNLTTEKTVSAYQKIYSLLIDNLCPLDEYSADVMSTTTYRIFLDDRALFCAGGLSLASKLRTMENDFGILPNPKYDENQENYMTSIDAGTSAAAVTVTASDLSRTGLIVEALCEKGSELVIPAYYDILLQGKSVRDEESSAMLDIIRSTATFDPLYVYNFGDFGFCFMNWILQKKEDIVSAYERRQKSAASAIEKFWNTIQDE